MNKLMDYLKRYYLDIILSSIIIILIIAIILLLVFKQKENVQIPEVKLEQNVEEIKIEKVKVEIKGNIPNPGVYELEKESRVIDVINMAGGLLENSNTELINLSQKLIDEMVIIIYTNEQIEKYKQDSKQIEYVYIEIEKCPDTINDACINKNDSSTSNNINNNTEVTENVDNKNENKLISINEANSKELTSLSGIGESKAQDIIKYREENGKFTNIEDIKKVSGIGDALFEKIKNYITV